MWQMKQGLQTGSWWVGCYSLFTPPTRIRQYCLVLPVPAVWTQLKIRQEALCCLAHFWWVLSRLDPVSNFQVFSNPRYILDWTVANWKLGRDKTKLSCLVANCVYTTDTDKTGQDSFVLSVSAVWTSYQIGCGEKRNSLDQACLRCTNKIALQPKQWTHSHTFFLVWSWPCQKWRFGENDPLSDKFLQSCSERIHEYTDSRFMVNFDVNRPPWVKWCVVLAIKIRKYVFSPPFCTCLTECAKRS